MTQDEACALLGITDEDDEKAIDNKYKKLMRTYHPDANAGDEEASQMASRINEAHDVILEGIRDGSFVLPEDRRPEDDVPTLASLRKKEQEKQKREVYFTSDDMVGIAEDMQADMSEKPIDYDALTARAKVLRKMVAAHRGAAPDTVVESLEQYSALETRMTDLQGRVSKVTMDLIRPGQTAMRVEEEAGIAADMNKKEFQNFELEVEELRMAMYKLMDGKNPKYRRLLDDAREFEEEEVQSRELLDTIASVDRVCEEIHTAIRAGREGIAEYQERRKSRIITVVWCILIGLAGCVITWLLLTRF